MLKRFLVGLLTAFCSLLVCILLLEVAVRVVDGVPVFSFENFVSKAFDAVRQVGLSRYDAKYGWAQESKVSRPLGDGRFTTGDLGVRMPSPEVRPLAEGGVLATGDSLTVGSEVKDEDSWPAQLETMIGTAVINAGNGGYSVDQTVMRTEEMTERLKPRAAIVEVMGITSFYSGLKVYGGAPKPYYTIEGDKLVLHNQPVPRVPEGTSGLGFLRNTLGYSYLVQFIMTRLDKLQWWIAAPQRYQWATNTEEGLHISCQLMQRLAALRDKNNMKVIILIQYGGTEITSESLGWNRQYMVDCVRAQNLPLVDTYEPLRAVYKSGGEDAFKQFYVMHDNGKVYGHMSGAGNRFIAKLIAEQAFGKTVQ